MSTLLPRLDAQEATKLRSVFVAHPHGRSFNQARLEEMLQHRSAFPATGGLRLSLEQMRTFRDRCCSASASAARTAKFDLTFDRLVGRLLVEYGQNSRSDMGAAGTWDFLTLVLLPDLVADRLGTLSSENSGLRSRITGGDRRHQLQRLWKRRTTLGNDLVDACLLTEDDYVQLLERNLTLERSQLARRIAHAIISSGFSGDKRRQYTRLMMKSVLQMSGVVHFDDTDSEHLDDAVNELHRWSVARLSAESSPLSLKSQYSKS